MSVQSPEPSPSLRDHFAAHTHIGWEEAWQVLRQSGVSSPTVEEVVATRARIRYAEADAMLALREGSDP